MPPFANLFTEHAGDLYKTYRVSEAGYRTLWLQLNELKQPISDLLAKNRELEREVNALKAADRSGQIHETVEPTDQSASSSMTKPTKLVQERCRATQKVSDTETDSSIIKANGSLKIHRLVKRVKRLVDRFGLSSYDVGRKYLDIEARYTNRLINNPASWKTLNQTDKDAYLKIHAWLVQNENKTTLQTVCAIESTSSIALNPFQIAKRANLLRNQLGISLTKLGQILNISKSLVSLLIYVPRSWETIDKTRRAQYCHLNDWCTQNWNAGGKTEPRHVTMPSQEPNTATVSEQAMRQNENETKFESNVIEMEEYLDTCDVAERVKRLKARLIKGTRFYRIFNLSQRSLYQILNYPAPWNTLTNVMKARYRNLFAWLMENEGKASSKRVVRKRSFRVKQCVEVDENDSLNTAEVAAKITALLREHRISHTSFSKKLSITRFHFDHLVMQPTPWAELNVSDKRIFRRIRSWTQKSLSELVEKEFL
jgi:hypothetical protein